ncbi:head decoration protein [Desulfoluna butyratoxydans]|uniref:Head decoration protein d n=1 Tax=Desulfoluna butyratoxydans TaxID=231438 RepID=A0A4U8YSX9_9BACT|nr:head decoration protein [Desulfoluna butyratoxydans]VFQ46904.1 head decoration protein d [Desulfoluna butyratoxydans]
MQQMIKHGDVIKDRAFLGDHPVITMSGTLKQGRAYVAGEVLGQVTADKKLTGLAPAASDGTQAAMAILAGDVDATASDEPCVIVAHAEAVAEGLVWPEGITAVQKAAAVAQLQAVGIYVK